ncbi:hypothetical protein ABIC66_003847 [Caulobacter sp. 1776]
MCVGRDHLARHIVTRETGHTRAVRGSVFAVRGLAKIRHYLSIYRKIAVSESVAWPSPRR